MSALIEKGKVSSLEEPLDRNGDYSKARVEPLSNKDIVSTPIIIPWYLRGEMGDIKPGDLVVYAFFEDTTGIILSRVDGEWPGIVPGDVEFTGDIKLLDIESSGVKSYNDHIHTGVESGGGTSGKPS